MLKTTDIPFRSLPALVGNGLMENISLHTSKPDRQRFQSGFTVCVPLLLRDKEYVILPFFSGDTKGVSLTEGRLSFSLPDQSPRYLVTKTNPDFSLPPERNLFQLSPDMSYFLSAETVLTGGECNLWIIEYSSTKRLCHHWFGIRTGRFEFNWKTHPEHKYICLALRLAKAGTLSLSHLSLSQSPELFEMSEKGSPIFEVSENSRLMYLSLSNDKYNTKDPAHMKLSSPHVSTAGDPPQRKKPQESREQTLPILPDYKLPDHKKEICIEFEGVGLFFHRKAPLFFNTKKGLGKRTAFWSLYNVSFQIFEGETVGIIGRNGSGKTTTSLLMAGVYTPSRGRVRVNGRVSLLALGTGLRPDLTGRDNILINSAYLGYPKKLVQEKMQSIIDFAELGKFIDEPVRTYSSGMKSRLTFAVAAIMEPEILIIDEVMSTGDQAFKTKAEKSIKEMREKAKAVIIVSHSASQIRQLCQRVIWLDRGSVKMDGDPKDVLKAYGNFCKVQTSH